MAKTICLDFDGVMNSYVSGWNDGVLEDDPVPGAIEWLNEIIKTHTVILHSARLTTKGQTAIVSRWLQRHGASQETMRKLQWAKKPHADVYLDDRAINFSGTFPSSDDLNNFKPWGKR